MQKNFDIASKLKALRSLSGLTQEEFAEHSGISYKFYQHIESGRKQMLRVDTVERICFAYGINLWEFFYPTLPKLKMSVKRNISSSPHQKKIKISKNANRN